VVGVDVGVICGEGGLMVASDVDLWVVGVIIVVICGEGICSED
jgi:hypothetical protein